jgi:hypothetical protein
MRQVHLEWVRETRDLGLLPEQDMHDRAAGGPEFARGRDDGAYPLERILRAALLVGRGSEAWRSDRPSTYWRTEVSASRAGEAAGCPRVEKSSAN